MDGKEVKLPGLGKVKSKWVWAGVATVAVIVGYAYYRRSHGGSSSTGSTGAAGGIDPQTGYPAGSPEDQAALAALSGGTQYGGGGSGSGQLYYDPATGQYDLSYPYQGSGSGSNSNTGPGTFTDNAYWVQYAIENVHGYSADQIQGALAAYLAGMGLTTTQMSIYQAALAVAGPPPNPPKVPVHLGGGGGGGGGDVAVPETKGKSAGEAHDLIAAVGLIPEAPRGQKPDDKVTTTSPPAGKKVKHGTRVTIHTHGVVK